MFESLERQSGLPIALDPAGPALTWAGGLAVGDVLPRTLHDLEPFLASVESRAATGPNPVVYTVYRDVRRPGDEATLRNAGLRFDLTVIAAGATIGRREFSRTAGHYHAPPPAGGAPFPEVYEVVAGRAYWLIQRPESDDPAVLEEIYAVEAGPSEKAVMPPGFGHVSVNAFSGPLVLANWVAADVGYDYEPYRRLRGGGYWFLEGTLPGTIEFIPNPAYRQLPALVKLRPREVPALGLVRRQPAYALARELNRLTFLRDPEAARRWLTIDSCYRPVI